MVKKFDIAALAPNHEGVPPSHFIVYTPKNVPGDELIKILDEFEQSLLSAGLADQSLYSTINNLKWVPSTSTLIISGEPGSIAKVEELIRRFDVPSKEIGADAPIASIENTSFLIYKLQYHQGNEILSALKQITGEIVKAGASSNQNLVNAINSLQWIKVTNSLLASGEPETLSKLKELIQNVDVPLKQVFIEVLVVETSLTNTQQFGLQWGGRMQYLNKFAAGTGNFPLQGANSTGVPVTTLTNQFQTGINAMNGSTGPVANNIPFASGFDLGVLGDIIMHKGRSFISLASLVNALETDTDSTILLNPKIIAQDGRTATIFIGSNLPFIGSLVQTQGGINQQQSSNIEYRDIGFNLTITPTIGNNNVVTLDITNDISEVIGGTSQGVSNQNQLTGISTTHTNVVTRVHVPDQHFVVLSGMIQDTKTRFRSAIPCLGGLPVIGLLFSENDRINSKHNLIIFMRPHVVSSASDFKAVTERQEDVFKDQAVLPVLKEEFDGGVDMVKRPEDE
jgi:type III secretion protein C